jgi:hypothetical protein
MATNPEEVEAARQLRQKGREVALELLLSKGVYSSISNEDDIGKQAEGNLRQAKIGTYDCYCTRCKQVTPFIIGPITLVSSGGGLRRGIAAASQPAIFGVTSICQRDSTSYTYIFRVLEGKLIKIGQHPSMADISFGELKEIDKGLDEFDRKELGTALGLFSHDAASGAFVYLRRVFERMISRAHDRLAQRAGAVADFDKKRMDEKIEALGDELPDRVVKNRAVFKVLSRGIHELTDQQCKALFPVVKAVIFQMLEQEEHKRRKLRAEAETDAALAAMIAAGVDIEIENPAEEPA